MKEEIRLGIVVSEFHYDITRLMEEKAKDHAKFLGAKVVKIIRVPGSFEIPLATKTLLERNDIDAVVCLGAIIKGETKHDEIIGVNVARKLMDMAVQYGKPVGLGIIGPGATRLQAQERIEEYARRAVEAAIKTFKRLHETKS